MSRKVEFWCDVYNGCTLIGIDKPWLSPVPLASERSPGTKRYKVVVEFPDPEHDEELRGQAVVEP